MANSNLQSHFNRNIFIPIHKVYVVQSLDAIKLYEETFSTVCFTAQAYFGCFMLYNMDEREIEEFLGEQASKAHLKAHGAN